MPRMNQMGLAPIILVGLLALGIVTAAGTYFVLEFSKSAQPVIPAQNPTPAPSVTENLSIEEVRDTNEASLLGMEGVEKVEVGEKDGKPCVVVFSFKETEELQNLENNGLEGYEVVVENAL